MVWDRGAQHGDTPQGPEAARDPRGPAAGPRVSAAPTYDPSPTNHCSRLPLRQQYLVKLIKARKQKPFLVNLDILNRYTFEHVVFKFTR